MSKHCASSMVILLVNVVVSACAEPAEDVPAAVAAPETAPVIVPEAVAAPGAGVAAPGAAVAATPPVEIRPAGEAREVAPADDGSLAPVKDSAPPAELTIAFGRDERGVERLKLTRAGQLLMLRQGARRAVGVGSAELELDAAATGPIVMEATQADTLTTIRGVVQLGAGGARLALVEAPREAAREAKHRHDCRAFHDGEGGYAVVCRVQALASAASLGADPAEGVFVQVGDPTLVRFDLPVGEAGVAARALGYLSAGQGVVVRAEASRVPGEARASLALLSAERAQPVVRPRIPHRHPRRPPHIDIDLLF